MKNIIPIILLIISTSNIFFAQNINLMTYNIRLDTPDDSLNSWTHRKEFLLKQIKYYKPEVIGIQEGLVHQVKWLDKKLVNYNYVGIGRADGKEKGPGEFSAVFYDTTRFSKLHGNTFWLSETPDKPSRGWDASLNRICTYVLLNSKSDNKNLWVFNTHFDHKGKVAREKSAELILNKMLEINKQNYPMVLMGDFNSTPNEIPIQLISKDLNDSHKVTILPPFGPIGTFCSFDICKPVERRIDYIFTSKKNIKVNHYAVFSDVVNQKYPSDHFPVFVNIELIK